MTHALTTMGISALTVDLDRGRCLYSELFVQGQSPFEALPFGDGAFDVAIVCMCLHHIPAESHARIIGDLLRVSRRGVLVVEEDPEVANWCRFTNGNLLRNRGRWHRRREEWEQLLEAPAQPWLDSTREFAIHVAKPS